MERLKIGDRVELTANMIFDSAVSPVPPRLRGDAGSRHMRFVAREFDVYVKIGGSAKQGSILGQVTSQDAGVEASRVTLLVEGEPRESTTTNGLGEFSLSQAPSGAWVFGAGTMGWGLGLDSRGVADRRIQRATANLLYRFVGISP